MKIIAICLYIALAACALDDEATTARQGLQTPPGYCGPAEGPLVWCGEGGGGTGGGGTGGGGSSGGGGGVNVPSCYSPSGPTCGAWACEWDSLSGAPTGYQIRMCSQTLFCDDGSQRINQYAERVVAPAACPMGN